jgi:hypothetical protein
MEPGASILIAEVLIPEWTVQIGEEREREA